MQKALQQSIVATLSYFDQFDYPLTAEELYRFLWGYNGELSYEQFRGAIDQPEGFVYSDGFVFLPGREATIAARQSKIKLIERKMKIAQRGARLLQAVPFIRAVYVCNTLASGWVRKESDIDVFIVTKAGRLWLARFLATIWLSLFGLRRAKKDIADKICLSFYIADNALSLKPVAIKEPDIYLTYWLATLVPLYDPDTLLQDIQRANGWVTQYIPRAFRPYTAVPRWHVEDRGLGRMFRRFGEALWKGAYGGYIEQQARGLQETKMKMNKHRSNASDTANVVVNDSMLKFHEEDRRALYKEAWQKKMAHYA